MASGVTYLLNNILFIDGFDSITNQILVTNLLHSFTVSLSIVLYLDKSVFLLYSFVVN